VRDTTFNGGKQRSVYGCKGSQAVPARPSGKGGLKRKVRRLEVETVER
jgi:hypothetical protein